MKPRNTLGPFKYALECVVLGLPLLYCYNNLLFRCIEELSYKESRRLLLLMIALTAIICGFVLFRHSRTGWTVALSMILSVGIYTTISYRKILGFRLVWTVGIASGVSLIYGLFVAGRKIKRRKKGRIIRRRLCRWIAGTGCIFGVAMFISLAQLAVQSIFGGSVLRPSVTAVYGTNEMSDHEYAANMEMMLKLQGDEWVTLKPQERLDVLQSAVNVEVVYFGLPHEINVEAAHMEEYNRAAYSDATHTIYINVEDLESGSSAELLEACCREVYHSYQYRIVESYLGTDADTRNLLIYKNAAEYAEEFFWFVYDSGSICDYYGPTCEKDAEEYAEIAVSYYASLFREYMMNAEVVTCAT